MIYFIKHFKGIAYFLAMLVLFQSCVIYKKTHSTIGEASTEDIPIKITTKDGCKYKLRWIEEMDGNIVSIKNAERAYLDKKEIVQIVKHDPEPHIISLESSLNQNGVLQILTKDKKGNYKSHEFIRIRGNDEIITGYKMISKDTLTVIIPIDQIEKIQLKDKGKSSGRTAGLIIGAILGVTTIAGLAAMANSFTDGWDFSQ